MRHLLARTFRRLHALPTNMVYDGTHLLLLDWDSADPMHPYYDLAVIAMFLRTRIHPSPQEVTEGGVRAAARSW